MKARTKLLSTVIAGCLMSSTAIAAPTLTPSQQQQLMGAVAPVVQKMQNGTITQNDIISAKAKVATIVPQAAAAVNGSSDNTPLGAIVAYSRLVCPTNWAEVNGQMFPFFVNGNISWDGIMLLLETGGTLKVVQNGTNISLALPDLRGEFIRGWNSSDPKHPDFGRQIGSFQDQLQANAIGTPNIRVNRETRYSTVAGRGTAVSDAAALPSEFTPKAGADIRPRNLAFLYCMKVKN